MIARPWIIAIVLILTAVTLVISGCISGGQGALPKDKYVAVEERLYVTCTLINGTYPFPPHTTVPIPFNYDNSANGSNWVEGSSWTGGYVHYDYPGVNDSFKALVGTSYIREVAPRDARYDLIVSNIYSYPYTGESGFTIRNIDRNGTIYASYNDTSIILKPGGQWVSPISSEIRAANGTGMQNEPYSYTAFFNATWTVYNLGLVNKANLTGRYNSS